MERNGTITYCRNFTVVLDLLFILFTVVENKTKSKKMNIICTIMNFECYIKTTSCTCTVCKL